MLTGTHLLQSCGIVLCEIETAEHQEQLFAINFNCFNTLKASPTSAIPTVPSPPYFSVTSNYILFLLLPLSLFLSSSLSVSFASFSLSFSHLSSPSLSISLLQLSLRCWYPLGPLSVMSRFDSWRPGMASPPQASLILIPPPPSSITLSSSDRHQGCQPVKEQN